MTAVGRRITWLGPVSTPPKPGKGLSVRVREVLYDDLAAMMRRASL